MAAVLSQYMAQYSQIHPNKRATFNISTRGERRNRIKYLVQQLQSIKVAEENYMINIPQNLQNSQFYENAEETITTIEEAIELLTSAY